MMGSSSSSDTRTAHTDELYKEFIFEKFNDIWLFDFRVSDLQWDNTSYISCFTLGGADVKK